MKNFIWVAILLGIMLYVIISSPSSKELTEEAVLKSVAERFKHDAVLSQAVAKKVDSEKKIVTFEIRGRKIEIPIEIKESSWEISGENMAQIHDAIVGK